MSLSHSLGWTLGLIMLLHPFLPKAVADKPNGEPYAILIGVRAYESTALRELPFAENDVTELATLLRQIGYPRENIVLMTASSATSRNKPRFSPRSNNIHKELVGFLSLMRAGDSVIVALAGHGVQFEGDEKQYFCPIDADLAQRKNLISIAELYKVLEKCRADVKLLLVDACRNDPFTKKAPRSATGQIASKTRPRLPKPPGGVVAFFSCSQGEEAFEDDSLEHGVFFHFVLKGLSGQAVNRDKEVTVGSLVEYVSHKVRKYTWNQLRTKQQPDLLGRYNPSTPLIDDPNIFSKIQGTTPSNPTKFNRIVAKVFDDRQAFEKCLKRTQTITFDDIDTQQKDLVLFSAERYLEKGILIRGEKGQYAGRTFSYPESFKPSSGHNMYAPGPIAPSNANYNEGGNQTTVTFRKENKPANVTGFGAVFIDVDYPSYGKSSIKAYDRAGKLLAVKSGFSGSGGSQLFFGIVTFDEKGQVVPAISRIELVNGSGWPQVYNAEGVTLDDFIFSPPQP